VYAQEQTVDNPSFPGRHVPLLAQERPRDMQGMEDSNKWKAVVSGVLKNLQGCMLETEESIAKHRKRSLDKLQWRETPYNLTRSQQLERNLQEDREFFLNLLRIIVPHTWEKS
jgi:hypothetical protein